MVRLLPVRLVVKELIMRKVVVRGAFDYDGDAVSRETGLSIDEGESVVQQQFASECDINTIVERFGLTGELPNGVDMPVSGDFTGVSDFHSAMNLVRQAQESFMSLPGHVRERFSHDPGKVLSLLEDSANRDEAIKLGIVAKPVEATRDVVAAVDELAARIVPKV